MRAHYLCQRFVTMEIRWDIDLPALDLANTILVVYTSFGEMGSNHAGKNMFGVLEFEQCRHVQMSRQEEPMCKVACGVYAL